MHACNYDCIAEYQNEIFLLHLKGEIYSFTDGGVKIFLIHVVVVIFKGDFACLQAINLTTFTIDDLVFMSGTKFLPVHTREACSLYQPICQLLIQCLDPLGQCGAGLIF